MSKEIDSQYNFWAVEEDKVLKRLSTRQTGLTDKEAEERLKKFGRNELFDEERKSGRNILASQFKNSLVLILVVSAIIAFFLGDKIEALVILSIVFLSAFLGFFQEFKAERVLRELKKYLGTKVKVWREGRLLEIKTEMVVTGDLVLLETGGIIPADLRLLEARSLLINESALTGESLPRAKNTLVLDNHLSLPTDLSNMAFAGTFVDSGQGKGVVVAGGKETFLGRTASYLQQNRLPDFQKNINLFSNFLLKITLFMVLSIFLANALLGKGYFTSFLFVLALGVGITPEILPIITTITLSNGALRMAKKKVIIKRLSVMEDLGNMDTLCCDKTGTLTEGNFALSNYLDSEGQKNPDLLDFGLLFVEKESQKGRLDFMAKAFNQSKEAAAVRQKIEKYQILGENEFDYDRRRSSLLVRDGEEQLLLVRGAPDALWPICTQFLVSGKLTKITSGWLSQIKNKVTEYEKEGFRVITLAQKAIQQKETSSVDESDLTLIGFLLFTDILKISAAKSVKVLGQLGVNVRILSGDSPIIVRQLCHQVGIDIIEERIINGEEIEDLTKEEIEKLANHYNIFARVTPEQKYKIVEALNQEGHVVGFLGDGVNDAPALKAADVGISVNSGTEVAKAAADIILLHKDLGVLSQGIIEGRKTFGNIIKYILNTISANYGNTFTVAISSLFLKFIPLLPAQILLNNFISDLPMLTIASDNLDEDLLKKPKHWNLPLISRFMFFFGLISSFFDLALIVPLLLIFKASPDLFRTIWFIESALSEMMVTFSIRTRKAFYQSRPSLALIIVSVLAILVTLSLPLFSWSREIFSFVPVSLPLLGFTFFVLFGYFVTVEIAKKYFFRKFEI